MAEEQPEKKKEGGGKSEGAADRAQQRCIELVLSAQSPLVGLNGRC